MPKGKLFDACCMIGKWPISRLAYHRLEELLSAMDYLGIERAIVFHTFSWQYHPTEGNRMLIETISSSPRLFPCWVLLPTTTMEMGSVENLFREMEEKRIKGVKLFPKDHNFKFSEWNLGELLHTLEGVNLPLFLDLEQIDLNDLWPICERHPELPVIVSRTSYRASRMLYSFLEKFPNFYIEISSFIDYQGIEKIVEKFGPGRLLFGTMQPLQDAGAVIARLAYAEIKEEERAMIGYRNLEHLLERIQWK